MPSLPTYPSMQMGKTISLEGMISKTSLRTVSGKSANISERGTADSTQHSITGSAART